MNLSAPCNRLGLVGTLALLLGPLGSPTQAHLIPWTAGYGYSSYYAPTAGYGYGYTSNYGYAPNYGYTANYGGHRGGGCCLLNLFGCCGLFGHGQYSAAYAPSYSYAPSHCAPACDPCGGSCGTYGNCGACGTSGYSLGGTWSGSGCPSGDCGIPGASTPSASPSPYSGEPVNPPSSTSPSRSTPPQTYREDGDDGFRRPQPIPGTGGSGGGGGLFLPEDDPSSSNSPEAAPSGVAPAGGATPDSQIERNDGGFELDSFKIPARDRADDDANDDEANDDESRVIVPLQIDAVATSVAPQRRRAHYRAIYRTPSVTRTRIPGPSGWEAIGDVPSLANVAR
jgi:hypothetical protein